MALALENRYEALLRAQQQAVAVAQEAKALADGEVPEPKEVTELTEEAKAVRLEAVHRLFEGILAWKSLEILGNPWKIDGFPWFFGRISKILLEFQGCLRCVRSRRRRGGAPRSCAALGRRSWSSRRRWRSRKRGCNSSERRDGRAFSSQF